jgi:hypothetical protein
MKGGLFYCSLFSGIGVISFQNINVGLCTPLYIVSRTLPRFLKCVPDFASKNMVTLVLGS